MLAETLFRRPRTGGLTVLQRRGEQGARELTTHRITLPAGGSADFVARGEETVAVLLEGRGRFDAAGESWPVERASLFTSRATALLLPPDVPLQVSAESPLEAILISTPAPPGGAPTLRTADEVTVAQRGVDLYQREVHDLFAGAGSQRLMVGETFNAPGNWSSYPPHKHDGADGELRLEEMYYYRVDPPDGFGLHVSYTAAGESVTHQVRDGDAVLIPYGYHSVSAPPRYSVYYLWAIAGDERRLAVFEDPAHRWVHDGDKRGVRP